MKNTEQQEASRNAATSMKAVAVTGSIILAVLLISPIRSGSTRLAVLVPVLITVLSRIWSLVVTHHVPDPYLDEVFHIPQAQRFCQGRYRDWDDKITTPPGLYLLPLLMPKGTILGELTGVYDCSTLSLRALNAINNLAVVCLAMHCRFAIEKLQHAEQSYTHPGYLSRYAAHTALNVALFPLLFFFSGLYYTDVMSTAVVLAGFLNCFKRLERDHNVLASDMLTFVLGITALLLRQTNVFWVVVFCGGLEAVHTVKVLRPDISVQPEDITAMERMEWFLWRFSVGDIHDPPVCSAWPDDTLFTVISLLVAGIWNFSKVLRRIWPYIAVLVFFVSFVVWNEGVVLGDKSNHIATIHLAQMLYIWPLFAFFSLPLFLPQAVATAGLLRRTLLGIPNKNQSDDSSPKEGITSHAEFPSPKIIVWALCTLGTAVLSLTIVHFNTIIHPFTLADNRHYMFYIFRYTIRRSWWIKYALVLPYTASRWLVWEAMGGFPSWSPNSEARQNTLFINHPLEHILAFKSKLTSKWPQAVLDQKQERSEVSISSHSFSTSTATICSTSTAVIFLLTTALSLITAPLVEPRYFIIPWVVWRLLLPEWRVQGANESNEPKAGSTMDRFWTMLSIHDMRLFVETAWFVAINLITGTIFLLRPYQWRAEDGTLLDEGRLQRFMW